MRVHSMIILTDTDKSKEQMIVDTLCGAREPFNALGMRIDSADGEFNLDFLIDDTLYIRARVNSGWCFNFTSPIRFDLRRARIKTNPRRDDVRVILTGFFGSPI